MSFEVFRVSLNPNESLWRSFQFAKLRFGHFTSNIYQKMDNFWAYGESTANGVARGASLGGFLYYTALTGMKLAVGGPIGWAGPAYYLLGDAFLHTSAGVGAGAFATLGGIFGGAQGAYNHHRR